MNKLIIILLLALGVSSCSSEKVVKDFTADTELPAYIVMSLQDSTKINYNTAILESENKVYLVNKDKDQKPVIVQYLSKEDNSNQAFVTGLAIGFLVMLSIAAFLSD